MARKGNPISVKKLGLNRSSDSSRFSEGDRAKRILVLLFFFVFILTSGYWLCVHYPDFSENGRKILFMIVGSGISVFFRRLGWAFPPLCASVILSMAAYASGDAPADLNQPDADGSEELGETFDLGVLEESWPSSGAEGPSRASVNQPEGRLVANNPAPEAELREIDQDIIWETLDAQEKEARAREHARIYRTVETLVRGCENEEAAMRYKARDILRQKGITLEDPKDVKRALDAALSDDWEHDIDTRLPHFRRLNRNFGKARCSIWNQFIDELRELGNPQVNARHKVD
uniref:Transmembrane protein n=1 Tax=Mirabilis himalaica TaxID=482968 RepID=A0A6M9TTC1_9CARY|nr:hypothetical protein [Mirabilis himalaica]QKN19336.1 hypothetical protein [Mirabilis himalaica]